MTITNPRTLAIIKAGKENPCLTRSRIAEHFGVSREFVRQTLNRANVNTRHIIPTKHRFCRCGNVITEYKAFLCYNCRHIQLQCDECGKMFSRHIKDAANQNQPHKEQFCSRHCKGLHLSKTSGFTIHPENIAKRLKGNSKYKHLIPEISERLWRGETLNHILVSFSIPPGNFPNIKRMLVEYKETKNGSTT